MRCHFLISDSVPDHVQTVLYHVGAVLNGIPSIVVTSAPPAVSAAWFPPHERVTATSISQMLNNVGSGLSFLLASILVKEPESHHHNSSCNIRAGHTAPVNVGSDTVAELRTDIEHYLLALFIPALLLFLSTIIYFPSKPPTPPSRSSREERLDFVQGALELVRNPSSWLLATVWSIPQAIWNNWCAMMVMSLTRY